VNTDKTKVIVFGKRKINPNDIELKLNGNRIEVVDSLKYLGILFKFNNNFDLCTKNLHDQGQKAMYAMLSKACRFQLDIETQLELFDKLVQPVCLYGSEIWGAGKYDCIEKIHLKFLKYVLKVKSSTPTNMIYGETGRFPLNITVECRMVNFWLKILVGETEKLTFVMYNIELELYNTGKYEFPWLIKIRDILNQCGIGYIWDRQDSIGIVKSNMSLEQRSNIINVNYVKALVKKSLRDQFMQKWRENINLSEKCCLYKEFKVQFGFEKYLNVLPMKMRINLCKFRICNTKLPIEVGRYQNVARYQRYCKLCNNNIIGDEYHFIMECSALQDCRKKYLSKYYYIRPNMLKFIQLMYSESNKILFRVSGFLSQTLIMLE
jgi:hypothetical protein